MRSIAETIFKCQQQQCTNFCGPTTHDWCCTLANPQKGGRKGQPHKDAMLHSQVLGEGDGLSTEGKDPLHVNLGQIVYFLKGIEMTEAHEKSPAKAPFKMDDKKSDKKAGQQSSGGGSNKRNQLLAPWQECGSQLGEVQESACQFKKGRS